MNVLVFKVRLQFVILQFTEAKQGVAKFQNLLYLHTIIRHIVNKFDCSSSFSLWVKGVHTDTGLESGVGWTV